MSDAYKLEKEERKQVVQIYETCKSSADIPFDIEDQLQDGASAVLDRRETIEKNKINRYIQAKRPKGHRKVIISELANSFSECWGIIITERMVKTALLVGAEAARDSVD